MLLALAAGACDYDAAWRTWCEKNHCDAGPLIEGDAGIAYHCDGCDSADDVCVVLAGAAACKKTCTGFSGGCGGDLDCKLAVSAYQSSLVPACLGNGSSEDLCGGSPLDCAAGRTCAKDDFDTWRCLEMCTPFKTVCTSGMQSCSYGMLGFPTEWGYCR